MNITEQFKSFALLGAEWVMWILIALSIISVSIMVERTIFFFRQRPLVETLIDKVKDFLRKDDADGAIEYLKGVNGVAAHVAVAALEKASDGANSIEEAAASARVRIKLKLEKNLSYLGTVGNNAPFVGLFGTVIGIIQAFNDLSMNTTGGASTVMSGISEALVATAIGLLVAIPAVVAFNTFQRRIKSLLGDSDALIHTVLSEVDSKVKDKG